MTICLLYMLFKVPNIISNNAYIYLTQHGSFKSGNNNKLAFDKVLTAFVKMLIYIHT